MSTETLQLEVDERNRETSRREVEAFRRRENSGRYFAYWHEPTKEEREASARAMATRWRPIATLTTWTGELLARVTWVGTEYRCPAFGGWPTVRVNFCARGIDGRDWAGTYYKSSGDYVRMRVVKGRGKG